MDKFFFIRKLLILHNYFAFFFLNFYDVDIFKFFNKPLEKNFWNRQWQHLFVPYNQVLEFNKQIKRNSTQYSVLISYVEVPIHIT
jgi:hypothetical protein